MEQEFKQAVQIQTKNLDHLGLVSSVINRIGLIDKVDSYLPISEEKGAKVSMGQRVSAMILNGLGFMNDRLYMVEHFFADKPLDKLIAPGISAKDLNDDALGRCLDMISKVGPTELFANLTFAIAKEQGLLAKSFHYDTSSITVVGDYEGDEAPQPTPCKKSGDETEALISYENEFELKYGYSKDHRPDLKQLVLGVGMTGKSGMPIWYEGLSGNSADKSNFQQTAKKIQQFTKQLKDAPSFIMVGDSALYTIGKLLSSPDLQWLTRVPETVGDAKALLSQPAEDFEWREVNADYQRVSMCSIYGGLKQRWQLFFSKPAYERELKTFERRMKKAREKAQKDSSKLSKQLFSCALDGHKAVLQLSKKCRYHSLQCEAKPVHQYASRGRPAKGEEPIIQGYHFDIAIHDDIAKQSAYKNRLGRFILATNVLELDVLTDEELLFEYKGQSKNEKGFRFLKDPWFQASSVYLKKPSRIQALMMVMTLCLMVYNLAELWLRKALEEKNETLPNQVKKAIKNPTFKWIAQLMRGISIAHVRNPDGALVHASVCNLSDVTTRIIRLFGCHAEEIYEIV
jgi:transposase